MSLSIAAIVSYISVIAIVEDGYEISKAVCEVPDGVIYEHVLRVTVLLYLCHERLGAE